MNYSNNVSSNLRLHLTNIIGTGACQLVESLLPAIERISKAKIERIELPDRGNLSVYQNVNNETIIRVYRRWLPNAVSRFLECTILANKFNGQSPLFVLGDVPLRCISPQTVFVQTPNLIKPITLAKEAFDLKYKILRGLFELNLDRVQSVIVQTEVMRRELERSYPKAIGRVHVIPQPVPEWLLNSGLVRTGRVSTGNRRLKILYPAASYPHKNHSLLSLIDPNIDWNIESFTLTLDPSINPAPQIPWVRCVGFQSPEAMVQLYSNADALVFLSKKESYGFPLIEAMFVGLPIICPDLPYARVLCGDEAIYFNPDQLGSLKCAVAELNLKLDKGWWPNWNNCLKNIPADWDEVAKRMLAVIFGDIDGVKKFK